MTATQVKFGLEPARKQGSRVNSTGYTQYPIANALASNIFVGDPVALLSTGKIQLWSSTNSIAIGVFMGCFYVDPTTQRPTWSRYFPTGTSAYTTTRMFAFVDDDPQATFYVAADASVTTGDIGLNFDVSMGAGSTLTGRSSTVLKASSRTGARALCQVIDVQLRPDNDFSDVNTADLFPIVEVRIVSNRQAITSGG